MAQTLTGGNRVAAINKVGNGRYDYPFFKKHEGVLISASDFRLIHGMGDLISISTGTTTLDNERKHFEVGKKKVNISDGKSFEATLEVERNDLANMAALLGQPLSTLPAIRSGRDIGVVGDFVVAAVDETTGTILRTDLIIDVGAKFLEVPGAEDGENTWQITLYSDDAEIYSVYGDTAVCHEIFYEAGSITNANAPDGALTAFTVGDGNTSFDPIGSVTPAMVQLRDDVTDVYLQYFAYVRLDGVDVSPADIASFVPATGILTFNTAPAAGVKLEWAYLCDNSTTAPNLNSSFNMMFDWENYIQ